MLYQGSGHRQRVHGCQGGVEQFTYGEYESDNDNSDDQYFDISQFMDGNCVQLVIEKQLLSSMISSYIHIKVMGRMMWCLLFVWSPKGN